MLPGKCMKKSPMAEITSKYTGPTHGRFNSAAYPILLHIKYVLFYYFYHAHIIHFLLWHTNVDIKNYTYHYYYFYYLIELFLFYNFLFIRRYYILVGLCIVYLYVLSSEYCNNVKIIIRKAYKEEICPIFRWAYPPLQWTETIAKKDLYLKQHNCPRG